MVCDMIEPAIVIVGYNRPDSIIRLINSINQAAYPFSNIELIVSIDECPLSHEVEKAAKSVKWMHGSMHIRRFPERQGLRNHVLKCGDLSCKYGAVIVLEDDLLVSPSYYMYAREAINQYATCEKIAGVSLYSHGWNGYANLQFLPVHNEYDAYLGQFSITWGQCWTKKQWMTFREWYAQNEGNLPKQDNRMPKDILKWSSQSWGKYFASYIVDKDLFYVIPYISLTTNFSEIGQHNTKVDSTHQVSILKGKKTNYIFPDYINAIKYDLFFERIFSDMDRIAGIPGNKICVNLNSIKNDSLGKEYILSIDEMDLPIENTYGLSMHPIDLNVDYDIHGNIIKLFRIDNHTRQINTKQVTKERRDYELYGYSWQLLLMEGLSRFIFVLKKKASKLKNMEKLRRKSV